MLVTLDHNYLVVDRNGSRRLSGWRWQPLWPPADPFLEGKAAAETGTAAVEEVAGETEGAGVGGGTSPPLFLITFNVYK